ncbi:MAG: toll/interleukin-1 receptor domain-containing protein [Chlorobiales bacterium]|nr:toll/interleukin-1 receptor domain-containing protein [Chlorobiales bacterium]
MKIFWSYARLDDMKPKRKISKLRREFENVLSQTVGKKSEVFFDNDALKWGVQWREEIERSIRECDGFVAVVSPSYFNRRMCIYELQVALDAEKRVFPLYYRACQAFTSTFKEDGEEAEINRQLNKASRVIAELQMMDFRDLRNEKLDSRKVEDFLDRMAEAVVG